MLEDSLTERHLLMFGTIIRWFARYERLMLEVVAALMSVDAASIAVMTRGLDFDGKRRSFLDLLRHRRIPIDQYDRICEYLKIPYGLTPLRDDIAHAAWAHVPHNDGIQPDWILRPPRGIAPSASGLGAAFGDRYDEKSEYSLDDFTEIVRSLSRNFASFANYLVEVRLIAPPTARSSG